MTATARMRHARAVARHLVVVLLLSAACNSRSDRPPPPQAPPTTTTTTTTVAATPPRSIDPPSAPGALAPNLSATPDGVLATWLEPAGEGKHRLRFATWTRGAWTQPVTIVEDDKIVANWADVPSVARGGDGALVAHWAQASGTETYAYDAVVARSTDGGTSWKTLGALHDDRTQTEHGFVSLLGEADGVRAFWLDGRATADGGAMTLRTATVGAKVEPAEVVDDRVCDCCGTSAVTTTGGPLVAYRDRSADEIRDIATSRRDRVAWTPPAAVHRDGWQIAGCPVNGPALAARDRRVAIAWYTYADSTHRVRAAFSDDAGATFGSPVDVDAPRGSRAPLGRVSIALTDDGDAIVGWLASEREDAAVLLRRVGRDGTLGVELRVGGNLAGRDAGFPRLARSGDALVVMWTESGEATRLRAVEVPLAAIAATGGASGGPAEAAVDPMIAVGSPAPTIESVSLDGEPASLGALRGKVVLVNLWATWCEPCRHELPILADLYETETARGLAIVAINIDRKKTREEIATYIGKRKLPFTVWLDPEDRASAALGVSTYPFNVLLGRDGKVLWRRAGAIRPDDAELRTALDAALR